MTKLRSERKIARETVTAGVFSQGKTRPVIVSMEWPNSLGFRLKGTRTTHYLTAEWCYWQAVKAAQMAAKREKAEARKARNV